MSYDLEVAIQDKPVLEDVVAFLRQDESLAWDGNLAAGANLVVEQRTTDGATPIFMVDGPDPVDRGDLPEPLVDLNPAPGWSLMISVHEAARPASVRVARALAHHLARACNGVVYDPQTDEIIRPGGEREKPQREAIRRASILNLEWVFPLSRFTMESLDLFLSIVKRVLPPALPRSPKGLRAACLDAAQPATSYSWEGREPVYSGSMYVERQGDYPVKGRIPAWSLVLAVDAGSVLRHGQLRRQVVDLFVQVAEDLGAFYGAAYVRRDYIERGGKLFVDFDTEGYLIPAWSGLPAFPTWLTWFGAPYYDLVLQSLAGEPIEARPGGLLLRMGDKPMNRDELEGIFPQLPTRLIQNSRIEQHVTHYPGGHAARGSRAIHEVAEFIPSME